MRPAAQGTRKTAYPSYRAATYYAILGDAEQALDWLENSVSRGFINYPFLHDHSPLLARLRSNPRFDQLMQRVKHEREESEV